ncbi:MAG TPA: aspartate aminotransferase family protein [Bryobacteraceae bacterium]|nr:aspartate aminotransferase family protein [Bryobacteraceae bacterium]
MSPEGEGNRSPARGRWSAEHLNETTREWLAEDARWFLHQSLSTPCLNVLAGCRGSYIEDLEGRRYLDFHGNNVHHVGFGNPRVIDAIARQMRELSFCPRRYTNLPAIRLAKKLAELAPGRLNKVLFAPGGTSAVGMALKLARVATGRYKTISLWDSFHGASLDAISVGGEEIFRRGMEPLLPGALHVSPPDPAQCPFQCGTECSCACAEHVDYVLRREGDVGAVIVETVRATSLIPPPRYLQILRDACDRCGALLIFDEIPHALGRSGRMFTCENFCVIPDMLLIGKALGGGIFPLAALIARDDLDVAAEGALGHYTHEKNPVACAAALAAIGYIEENQLPEKAREMGEYTLARLREMQVRRPVIRAVRGLGLLLGVELASAAAAERVLYRALGLGLSFKVTMGTVLTLTPPLTISREEMDEALAILDRALEE